jgi:hypothetical protein
MHLTHALELIAILKGQHNGPDIADHTPVGVPNTLSKIVDKAVLIQFQGDYSKALMPRQLVVGIKFAAELLIMDMRMTLHLHGDYGIINIDLRNAFNAIWRAVFLRCHLMHARLKQLVPYLRAKLRPRAPMWAQDSTMWHDEGLLQGDPSLRFPSLSLSIRR